MVVSRVGPVTRVGSLRASSRMACGIIAEAADEDNIPFDGRLALIASFPWPVAARPLILHHVRLAGDVQCLAP